MYVVRNSTTGAFTLTFQTDVGTGVVIKAGASSILYCDGKDIVDPYGAAIGALQTGLSNANASIAATNANLDTTNTNVAAKMPLAGGGFTGLVRYGTTSSTPGIEASTYGVAIDSTTGYIACSRSVAAYSLYVNNATGTLVYFGNTAGQKGSITTNGSSTAYNTTSDYRLKENVVPISGALDRLGTMRPVRFNFIVDPAKQVVDGFIAHELAQVVPEAVFGVKDAVEHEPVYRDGYDPADIQPEDVIEVKEVVVPQAVDYSKVTPLLAAAILELWGIVKGNAGA
ncbi:tail fiber domain-containing protein [Pandoraea pnomenusa]|nr:tail fiber domain-containing protein [Pandoraea pnomenusa]